MVLLKNKAIAMWLIVFFFLLCVPAAWLEARLDCCFWQYLYKCVGEVILFSIGLIIGYMMAAKGDVNGCTIVPELPCKGASSRKSQHKEGKG